jgi:hypothetical protein
MPVPFLAYICFWTYLIPVVIGLIRFRKLTFPMRILFVLCVLAFVEISITWYVAHMKIKNYFIDDFYMVVEVLFIYAVYYVSAVPCKNKLIIATLGVLFFLIWLATMVVAYNPDQIGGGISIIERVFLIAGSLITLQSLMADSSSKLVEKSLFWMVVAVLLNATGTLVMVGLSDSLLKTNYWLLYVAYHINWSLDIAANVLYSKALLCKS